MGVAAAERSWRGTGRGRFNRKGVAGLYLFHRSATAIAEYQGTDPLLRPGTLATYLVTLGQVADFSAGFTPGLWSPLWEDQPTASAEAIASGSGTLQCGL